MLNDSLVEMKELWVFGYGSLIWRPEFEADETSKARLFGYHRALCVYSHVHRGTPERAGLVLGLDRGGSCVGLAMKVPERGREEIIAALRRREMSNHVYHEKVLPLQLADGRHVSVLAYVVDRSHSQYAGPLSIDNALAQIRDAVGKSGRNEEYVINTAGKLKEMGIEDRRLQEVASQLR